MSDKKNTGAGKGDKRRVCNEQKIRDNWDRIDWSAHRKTEKLTGTCGFCKKENVEIKPAHSYPAFTSFYICVECEKSTQE